MNQDRVEFNTTRSDSYDNIPVLQFLPPTDEPSSFALAISVTLVGCLIVAICGNASQMALQIYTRRLNRRTLPQCFIAVLFFVNFLIPFALPSLILEKLVGIWMFGQLSCNAYHILTTAERVIVPWGIAALHASIVMFLTRPNRLTRIEGMLASFAFIGLLLLTVTVAIPQGMAAELKFIHKDKIDGEHYIMLIHTYECLLSPDSNPATQLMRFGFEFVAPLSISIYLHRQLRSNNELKHPFAIMRNLVYILIIHYVCNILCYIPEKKWSEGMKVLDKQADLKQLLAFLSPTLLWYPLGQLSGVLSRCFGQNRRSTAFSNSR
uniref:G_PROTEIN_RECEP_F1_2 domain-containing protein n=1 Tax=Angiostrongylus cantonensis TaxID=6313 RepID=A0A0K0CX67_ANGCA